MGIRAAGIAGLSLLVVGAASAAAQTIEMAASAPGSAVEGCLRPGAPMSAAVIDACNEAIKPGGLQGVERALGLYRRGRARQAVGEKAGADADLRAAAAQYTETMSRWHPQPGMLHDRARAWHALGEVDKALADYDDAAGLDPLDSMIFLNRGILLAHEKGDRSLALIDFERVLALEPLSSRIVQRAEQEKAALMPGPAAPTVGERGPEIGDRAPGAKGWSSPGLK